MSDIKVLQDYFHISADDLTGSKFREHYQANKRSKCKVQVLRDYFNDTEILCEKYDMVVNGEGSENEKIDTFYSSSLQSLLFFGNVSQTHPLIYDNVTYTEVYFEYKNPVIKFPSSVDVVLIGKNNEDGQQTVLFVESKLYEVIRDSTPEGKPVVGRSYFSSKRGYENALKLSLPELRQLGFEIPGDDSSSTEKRSYIIHPIVINGQENKYVYSYGIKQFLSHVIGILNNLSGKNNLNDVPLPSGYEARFLTVINKMPKLKIEDAEKRTEDFINHYNTVADVLKSKLQSNNRRIKIYSCMTYQKFYSEVSKNKFTVSQKICNYYHLNDSVE